MRDGCNSLGVGDLTFSSFGRELRSAVATLAFFVSANRYSYSRVTRSGFGHVVTCVSGVGCSTSGPKTPTLDFSACLRSGIGCEMVVGGLCNDRVQVENVGGSFVKVSIASMFHPRGVAGLVGVGGELIVRCLEAVCCRRGCVRPTKDVFTTVRGGRDLLGFPSVVSVLGVGLLFGPLGLPKVKDNILRSVVDVPSDSLEGHLKCRILDFSLRTRSLDRRYVSGLSVFFTNSLFGCRSMYVTTVRRLGDGTATPVRGKPLPTWRLAIYRFNIIFTVRGNFVNLLRPLTNRHTDYRQTAGI